MPIMQFVGNLGYVMVALLGGVFVIQKKVLKSVISSPSSSTSVTLHSQSSRLHRLQNLLQSSAAASERVFEFLEEPEESQNEKNPVDVNTLTGDVQFEHVKVRLQSG